MHTPPPAPNGHPNLSLKTLARGKMPCLGGPIQGDPWGATMRELMGQLRTGMLHRWRVSLTTQLSRLNCRRITRFRYLVISWLQRDRKVKSDTHRKTLRGFLVWEDSSTREHRNARTYLPKSPRYPLWFRQVTRVMVRHSSAYIVTSITGSRPGKGGTSILVDSHTTVP